MNFNRIGCVVLFLGLLGNPLLAQAPEPVPQWKAVRVPQAQSESYLPDNNPSAASVRGQSEIAYVNIPERPYRIYASTEYLLWWMRGANLPALATQGNINDPGIAGAIGQPHTVIVLGNGNSQTGPNSGGRFTLGTWLDTDHVFGVEANFFFLGQRVGSSSVSAPGDLNSNLVLARPFIQEGLNLPNAQQIALPGQSGFIGINQRTQLYGAEANLRFTPLQGSGYRVSLLSGFRFLALDDALQINSSFTDLTRLAAISSSSTQDSFTTRNRFYGGQLGATIDLQRGKWLFSSVAKIALGGTQQIAVINGSTVSTINGATVNSATGLLAQPTNMGQHERNVVTFVPEFGLTVGYRITERLTVYAGYTLLYDSDVARAANQVNLVSNIPTLSGRLPATQKQPAFHFQGTTFWAQGLTCGLALQF